MADHLGAVLANGRARYDALGLGSDMRRAMDLSLLLHDLGKATDYFQTYIHAIADHNAGYIDQAQFEFIRHDLGFHKNHARLSAMWIFLQARELFGGENRWPALIFLAVLKHHGNLGDLTTMWTVNRADEDGLRKNLTEMSAALNYAEMGRIARENGYPLSDFNHSAFVRALDQTFFNHRWRRLSHRWRQSRDRQDFWDLSLLFSTLLACDKGECIFRGPIYRRCDQPPPISLVDRYKQKDFANEPDTELNRWRERVYQSVADNLAAWGVGGGRFFSVNAPTGVGKTLALLSAAIRLRHARPNLRKIVYCLPFTSVIDQNTAVFQEVFRANDLAPGSDDLLAYHHLAEPYYRPRDDRDEIDDYQGEYLVTQFESNLNVTTFFQLLHGMFTGKNREIRKLHGLANSVVILDEVQSVPARYWPLVRQTFRELAPKLNMTIVLATATMPMIFSEADGEIRELVDDRDALFHAMDRIELDASLLAGPMSLEAFAARFAEDTRAQPGTSALAVLNTKRAAKTLFRLLKDKHKLGERLLFLSTDLPPCERLKRIRRISPKCEKNKREKKKPWLVISTQLVEAGVDIDIDRVYRDLAPLDAVFQAAGRCNRNQTKGRGRVFLLDLRDDNRKSFAGYVYGLTELDVTRDLLGRKAVHPEAEFRDLALRYFRAISDKLDQGDSAHILDAMARLDYRTAFRRDAHDQAFQLIEEQDVVPALVLLNEEANARYREFLAAQGAEDLNGFEKKKRIRDCYRRLAPYIVSVRQKFVEPNERPFLIISDTERDLGYDHDTGVETQADHLFF